MDSVKIEPRKWNVIHAMRNCMIKNVVNNPSVDKLNKRLYSTCFLHFLPDYKEPVDLLLNKHALVIKKNTEDSFNNTNFKYKREIDYENVIHNARETKFDPNNYDKILWDIQCNSKYQIGDGGFEISIDIMSELDSTHKGNTYVYKIDNGYNAKQVIPSSPRRLDDEVHAFYYKKSESGLTIKYEVK